MPHLARAEHPAPGGTRPDTTSRGVAGQDRGGTTGRRIIYRPTIAAHHHGCRAGLCAVGAATSCTGGILMPFGGNDWLALTPEIPLEPVLPICDPHHHFWDFRTERIPYQRYLLHELAADVNCGHNVRSTVFIEARAMYRADG